MAIVFPTHQLIDQVLSSWDLKAALKEHPVSVQAFRPRSNFTALEYAEQKTLAKDADLLFCTSVSVILDQRASGGYNGVTERDIIIFDEADQLPQFAALSSDVSISREELKALNIKAAEPKGILAAISNKKNVPAELKAKTRIVQEGLDLGNVWFQSIGFTEGGALEVRTRLPGRLLKKVSNRPSTIFISATLSINGSFDDFHRAMGIEKQSRFSGIIDPKKHGELEFEFALDHEVGSAAWLKEVCRQIESSEQPVLVASPSHELSEKIGAKLKSATIRTDVETTSQAAGRMGSSQVLIAAGAWAGLDTPVKWKTIVVPRIPYTGPLNLRDEWKEDTEEFNEQTAHEMVTFIDSKNAAARRLKQVFGRGLRSPDASCCVVICDARIDRFKNVAPQRFRKSFAEGIPLSSFITRSERHRGLRKAALAHYGEKCMACGFEPIVLRQLEVHHLFPLADRGPDNTKLEEVAVLCRNCHGWAHSETPPIPLDRLKVPRGKTTVISMD